MRKKKQKGNERERGPQRGTLGVGTRLPYRGTREKEKIVEARLNGSTVWARKGQYGEKKKVDSSFN